MKITIESTDETLDILVDADGSPLIQCRLWAGTTQNGVAFTAYVAAIKIPHRGTKEFEGVAIPTVPLDSLDLPIVLSDDNEDEEDEDEREGGGFEP